MFCTVIDGRLLKTIIFNRIIVHISIHYATIRFTTLALYLNTVKLFRAIDSSIAKFSCVNYDIISFITLAQNSIL
jgi:hypothetical protein